MTILKLEDIHVGYGNIKAVKGISMEINKGEVVTLIGSNGAGKTTTMKTLSGLIKPTSGRIEFMGQDITQKRTSEVVSRGYLLETGRIVMSDRSEVLLNSEEILKSYLGEKKEE